MSWTSLKNGIATVIKTNGNQEITGNALQGVLNTIVNSLGAHATLAGFAIPSTSPGTPDGPVFYFAFQEGSYPNFGATPFVVSEGEFGVFVWDGTTWSTVKYTPGVDLSEIVSELEALNAKIDQLEKQLNPITNVSNSDIINGGKGVINKEGQITTSGYQGYGYTDLIAIGSTCIGIEASGLVNFDNGTNYFHGIAFYDSNGDFIAEGSIHGQSSADLSEADIPTEARYVRFGRGNGATLSAEIKFSSPLTELKDQIQEAVHAADHIDEVEEEVITKSNEAKTIATNAYNAAVAAQSSASTASADALLAQQSAANAEDAAEQAGASATQAASDASDAVEVAEDATELAQEAKTESSEAKTIAQGAVSTANSAAQEVATLAQRKIQETDLSDAVKQKLESNVTINNAPDDEDLEVDESNHIKLADKPYTPSNNSGLGRRYVRKMDDITEQGFFESGYRYIIQYKHDLDGGDISVPANCVLEFQGGMICNGNMSAMLGEIDAPNMQIFDDMTFDPTKCNFDMNICWMGAKGDWYDGAATWTDNTDAIQAAFNTYLGIYIPAGKFACNNPITLNPQQSWNDDSKDSSNYVRGKCVRGAGHRNSWLVCTFNDSTKDFFTVRHLYGKLIDILVTSSTDGFANYGVRFCDALNNSDIDIAVYGNFDWAVCHNGMVQASNMRLLVTNVPHYPSNQYPKRPNNGVKFADVPYFWMFKLYIRCEYVQIQGISITCTGGGLFDFQFMAEGCGVIGEINTGTTSTLLHDSYTEARPTSLVPQENVQDQLTIRNSQNIEIDRLGNAHLEIINSNVIVRRAIIRSVDANSFVQLDRCVWDSSSNNIGKNITWIGSRAYNDTNLARSGASISDYANSNLCSNRYLTSGNVKVLCGEGCEDVTHYDGFPHSIKINGTLSGGHIYQHPLFSSQIAKMIDGSKWLIISVLLKDVDGNETVYAKMNIGHGYTQANTDIGIAKDKWISLRDGWYMVIGSIKLDDGETRHSIGNEDWTIGFYFRAKDPTKWDDEKSYSENIQAHNDKNASYYLTQIMAIIGAGSPRSFKLKDGDDAYGNIRSGVTANRPLFMPAGFIYFDTTLSCPVWADGIGGWVNGTGATV